MTGTAARAPTDSRWERIGQPIRLDSASHVSTPKDYEVEGLYATSTDAIITAHSLNLTFREMVNEILKSYPYEQRYRYDRSTSLEDLVANVPASYLRLYDSYDHAQGEPKPWNAVFRAHVLRCVKGWKNATALYRYLKQKPFLCTQLGFEDIPDESMLWRAWDDRLTDVRDAVRDAAEVVVDIARYHNISVPEPEFLPNQPTEAVTKSKSKDTLAREKARQVWKGAKPIVTDCFNLNRASNASVPEDAFWEQHAYVGMRTDMHANDGAQSFTEDTTRQRTPSGDSHRLQTKTLGVARVRRMLRETARTLVSRAKSKDKMGREVTAAIDISHRDSEFIQERLPRMYERFDDLGVDMAAESVEVAPTFHYGMGGVAVDEYGETDVDGLFAIGETMAGVHGANRLGGNSLAETVAFGAVTGDRVAQQVDGPGEIPAKFVDELIEPQFEDLTVLASHDGSYEVETVVGELQELMWDHAGILRDEESLQAGLETLSELRAKAADMDVGPLTRESFEFAVDIGFMLTAAEAVPRGAVERTESRGAHYRTDFPETDLEWQRNIYFEASDVGGMRTETDSVRTASDAVQAALDEGHKLDYHQLE